MQLGMVPQSLSLSSARRAGFSSKLFDHRTAHKWALCSRCTVSYVRPPEPTTTIIHHGRIGSLSLFCLSVDSLSRIFSYYRSMAWIDSTKKIQQKMTSGNDVSVIFSAKSKATSAFSWPWRRKCRISFDLGGIFAYRLFEYSNRDVLPIFEKAANKNKLSLKQFPPCRVFPSWSKLFSGRFFGR
jgi:hypothetical protein